MIAPLASPAFIVKSSYVDAEVGDTTVQSVSKVKSVAVSFMYPRIYT